MNSGLQQCILGREDIFQIVDHLDHALAVLYRSRSQPAPADVHLKSLLTTLRRELLLTVREQGTGASRAPLALD